MADRTRKGVKPYQAVLRTFLTGLVGLLVPLVGTLFITAARTQYDFPFIFLYLPAVLFASYLGGLLPGVVGAVVSTLLADYLFIDPPGVTIAQLRVDALPTLLFLLSGFLVAGAGAQYRQHQLRLQEDLMHSRRRERGARLIASLMAEFARQSDLRVMLDAIARQCTEVLGEWCVIALIEPDSPWLRPGGLHHQDPEKVSRLRSAVEQAPVPKDNPLIVRILEGRKPVPVYPDDPLIQELIPKVPVFREVFSHLNVQGGLSVPIHAGGETLGLFSVGTESPRRWDGEDLRLAAWIADRAGAAIQNARLTDARNRAQQRLAMQYEVGRALSESANLEEALPRILRAIGETLAWVWAAFWIVDRQANLLRCIETWHPRSVVFPEFEAVSRGKPFPPGVGLPGRVWTSGQPAWIPDVVKDDNFPRAPFASKEGLHGAFGFPVLIGREVLGVAECFNQKILRPDEDLLQTVALIGNQIGQFIERKRAEEGVRESEAFKGAILETALDCIISIDHEGKVVEFNAAAERTFGYSRADAVGREMAELIIPPSLRERHRRGLAHYLATGEGPIIGKRVEMSALRADGTEFPVEVAITRIPSDGPPIFAGHLRDVTERKHAEETRRFLAEATRELAASLDYKTTLENLARLAVPRLADWCVVDMVEEDGSLRQVAIAHRDPAKVDMARELRQRYPPEPGTPHPVLKAVRTGQAEVVSDIPDSMFVAVARDAKHREAIRQASPRSYMVVPLNASGRTLGVITFATAESDRRYGPADLALAEELARRAALAVDNARLYAAERDAHAQAERDARRVSAINRIIAIASSSLNLGEVFDEFAEALQLLLPYARVTVSLHDPERDWLTMPYFKGPELTAPAARLEGPKAGTARGRVLDSGRAYVRRDTLETQEFSEDHMLASAGIRSYAIVPMSVGGRVIGTLNFGHHKPGFYTEEHARLVQPIADQLALTISRFQLFDQVRRRAGELSETLQRALLPADLPKAPFTAIGALYRPADPEAKIGGDWYDAILLPEDRVLVSIGDVAGQGTAAAAAMGQVRNIARAYALEGRPPAQILATINRFLSMHRETPQLSMWIATLDPFSGDLVYSSAGHPPPSVLADGQADFLSTGGPPLGTMPSTEYAEARAKLTPGTRLVAYTDGLSEATRDVVEGERRLLEAVLFTRDDPPSRAVEGLVERVLDGTRPHDDIAVLILDTLPVDAPLFFSLPASPENLHRIRRAVRALAQRVGISRDRVEDVVMAVGEAALNVVEHAYGGRPGNLTVHGEIHGNLLTITVRDFGRWRPQVDRGRGRGTRIVEGFADSVRTHTGPAGTLVELTWGLNRATLAVPQS